MSALAPFTVTLLPGGTATLLPEVPVGPEDSACAEADRRLIIEKIAAATIRFAAVRMSHLISQSKICNAHCWNPNRPPPMAWDLIGLLVQHCLPRSNPYLERTFRPGKS
jgi:hypothetical protein